MGNQDGTALQVSHCHGMINRYTENNLSYIILKAHTKSVLEILHTLFFIINNFSILF